MRGGSGILRMTSCGVAAVTGALNSSLSVCPAFSVLMEVRCYGWGILDSWAMCDITPQGVESHQVYDLGQPI